MAFYKKSKKDSMVRTVFNNIHEPQYVDSNRKFYAFVEIDGKEYPSTYIGKFRSAALTFFEEEARLLGGKFNGKLYAFKN